MKTLLTKTALVIVLATLIAADAASAATRQHGKQLQSRSVSLPTSTSGSADWFTINRNDHASSPYAGGG